MEIVLGNTISKLRKLLPAYHQIRFYHHDVYCRSSGVLCIQRKPNHNYTSPYHNLTFSQYGQNLSYSSKKDAVQNSKSDDSVSKKSKRSVANQGGEDWSIIYRCTKIIHARAIQRIKLYQTILSCCIITPTALGCYFHGLMDYHNVLVVCGGSALACGMLFLVGNLFGRLIGIIYTSQNNPSMVKVSRLTFWGNRADVVYPISDFFPFSELDVNPKDVYFPIKQYSIPEKSLLISLSYGLITNLDEFERVFGPVPQDWDIKVQSQDRLT